MKTQTLILLTLFLAFRQYAQGINEFNTTNIHNENQQLYEADLLSTICVNQRNPSLSLFKTLEIPPHSQYNLWKYIRREQPIYGYNELLDIYGMDTLQLNRIKHRLVFNCKSENAQKPITTYLRYIGYTRLTDKPQNTNTNNPKSIHQLWINSTYLSLRLGIENDPGERYGSFGSWNARWTRDNTTLWLGNLYLKYGYGNLLWSGFKNKYTSDYQIYQSNQLFNLASLSDEISHRPTIGLSHDYNENLTINAFVSRKSYMGVLTNDTISTLYAQTNFNTITSRQGKTEVYHTLIGSEVEWTHGTKHNSILYTYETWNKPLIDQQKQFNHSISWTNKTWWHRQIHSSTELNINSLHSAILLQEWTYRPEKFWINTHLRYHNLNHRDLLRNRKSLSQSDKEIGGGITLGLHDFLGNQLFLLLEASWVDPEYSKRISQIGLDYIVTHSTIQSRWKWLYKHINENNQFRHSSRILSRNSLHIDSDWKLYINGYLNYSDRSQEDPSVATEYGFGFDNDRLKLKLFLINHRITEYDSRIYIYEYGTRFSYPFTMLNRNGNTIYSLIEYTLSNLKIQLKYAHDVQENEHKKTSSTNSLEVMILLDLD